MNMKFEFEKTGIEGLQIIHPFIVCDERGYFMKTFEASEFKKHGIEFENAEDVPAYRAHPLHQEAKKHFHHLLDQRYSADYEV